MSATNRSRYRGIAALLALGCALVPGAARALSALPIEESDDRTNVVIQNRAFKMAHELTLEAGLLPLDAYYKGVTGTLRYTWHFSEFQALELINITYSYDWNTRLKESLINEFGAMSDDYAFREAVLIADIDYVLKPFYGKMALFNRLIVRSEFYLNVGPAYILYLPSSIMFTGLSHRPGLNYGAGIRLFAAEWFSVRVDLRHYIVFAVDGVLQDPPRFEIDNVLYLGLGGSFNIGYD